MGVVESGNKIYVAASSITEKEVTVNWQQNLSQRSRQYYVVSFINKDQGDEESVLFIQKDYLDAFKGKKTTGDEITVVVDGSFQYGQDKQKTKRWLVYHDKSSNAFQWRFVSSAAQSLGSKAVTFGGGILKSFIGVDLSIMQGLLGDPLRNF